MEIHCKALLPDANMGTFTGVPFSGSDQGGDTLLRNGGAADAQVRGRAQQPRQRAEGAGQAGERERVKWERWRYSTAQD